LTVSLLGGESSGKTTLAQSLDAHLRGLGWSVALVPEHLRSWCEQHRRAPAPHEQAALAAEQDRLIAQAQSQAGVQVVLADTSALMVAIYSELYFNDRSLFPDALERQRRFGLTLLMGLDIPWVADGLFRDGPGVREAADRVLRRELEQNGLTYQAIYGEGPQRLNMALRVIGHRLGIELVAASPSPTQRAATWNCERCSDPACEHRLFSRLLSPQ
jgi:HTH-type transcriptional repressor of NAD biosynthesis genes